MTPMSEWTLEAREVREAVRGSEIGLLRRGVREASQRKGTGVSDLNQEH